MIADNEAERGLLGAITTSGLPGYLEACESVSAADFCGIRCQAVWLVMRDLEAAGTEITIESVARKAKSSWMDSQIGDTLTFLAVDCAGGISVGVHVQDILRCSKLRRISGAGQHMVAQATTRNADPDAILAESESMLLGEQMTLLEWVEPKKAVDLLTDDLQRRYERKGQIQGVPTGFHEFDQRTDGLQYGEQTIIAARPSMGKTALAMNIAEHAAMRCGIPTLVVTLEMSVPALMRRMLSSSRSVTMHEIRGGKFTAEDFKSFTLFASQVSKVPLYFIPCLSGTDSKRLCAVIRRKVRQHGIKLVIIDYLQKIKGSGSHEKKTYEIAEASGDLMSCAKQTRAAFLTLAQLNRDNENGDRLPRLSDIADSGQIERDADTVALLHRSRSDPNIEPMLIIAKQRDGECGQVKLSFDGKFCRFGNPV